MKTPLFLAIAIVFAIHTNSFSQREYKSGYIIRTNGDSLAGLIAFRNRSGNGNACYFKEQKSSQEVLLSPLELKTFGYVFGERFDSKMLPVVNGQVFAKTLVKGQMSLYSYYDIFYVETNKIYRLEDKKSKNGEPSQYIVVLNELISECSLTTNETKYNQKDLLNLVQNYNRCKGGEGVKYQEERESRMKINFFVHYGNDVSFLKVDGFDDDSFTPCYSPVIGVGLNISFPSILPKWFASLEYSYLKKNYRGYREKIITAGSILREDYAIDVSFTRIPISVGYTFGKKRSAPYVKGGLVLFYKSNISANVLSERETLGTVSTTASEYKFKERNPFGFWIGAGFDKRIWTHYKIFVEVRYETTNGFIGSVPQPESSIKNIVTTIGIKF